MSDASPTLPLSAKRSSYTLWGTRRWKRVRKQHLQQNPLCAFCLAGGRYTPATVVDHVVPHHLETNAFWLGELQSLCKFHHDTSKAEQERRGYASDIGPDGWPVDRNHPIYRL